MKRLLLLIALAAPIYGQQAALPQSCPALTTYSGATGVLPCTWWTAQGGTLLFQIAASAITVKAPLSSNSNITITGSGNGFSVNGVYWTAAAGAPSGGCTTGNLFSRTDGGVGTTLYVCAAGAWHAVAD